MSSGSYASLNLGDHVGDDPVHVARNRRRLEQALNVRPVFLRQVHGTRVVAVDAQTPDGVEADACYTRDTGVACTIMVADCLPVLMACDTASMVGAAHAGWRGLVGVGGRGILEALWEAMQPHLPPAAASRMRVWLGPCIGPRAFEVGSEVRAAFVTADARAVNCFAPHPHTPHKWLADLPALARQRLHALGITDISGNDGTDEWCTVSNPSRFFSHRRDRVSGRFAACVWRVA